MKQIGKTGHTGLAKLQRALWEENRGSSIVIVIIAMAMIGILASTILWSAYINYMIKVTDVKNKNSFYSAETVMEQIMAGMQHEASAAVSTAYQDVMKNWDYDENESNRYNRFATAYLDTLIGNLRSSGGSGYYDRAVLEAFIDDDLLARMDMSVWNDPDPDNENKMELVNNSTLILYNIHVAYTDANDYLSIINTDICIEVPKLVFYQNASIDGLYEYALIGNMGIRTTSGSSASVVDGSIYAGINEDTKKGGITVNSGSSLTVQNGELVISKGDILVEGPGAGFFVRDISDSGSQVYAQNLTLNSGVIGLDSRTYVANDLTLNGQGSKATLTKEYYGYGYSTATGLDETEEVDASKSSAIIINGRNATVDLSGINRLLLAGRAYIGQSLTQNTPGGGAGGLPGSSAKPVLMGESIAVKGDQIAYLVPAECIGTLEGKTVIGQNPLNGEMVGRMSAYESAYGSDFAEVDFYKPVYKLNNMTLNDFGVTDMKHIRKIYAQYNSADSENKTLLYYYLVMEKEEAERYFVQYYNFNASKETLDNYFDTYASGGIVLGDYESENTQYTILGNSLVSDALTINGSTLLTGMSQPQQGEGGTEGAGDTEEGAEGTQPGTGYEEVSDNAQTVQNAKDEAQVLMLAAGYAQTYAALTTNLSDDASTIGPNQTVFNSIIRENMLRSYLGDPLHPEHYGTVEFRTEDGKAVAVLTNANEYTPTAADCSSLRLIVAIDSDPDDGIAGGNVKLGSNFTGLIVAQGTVTFDHSIMVKRDKMGLYQALNTPLSEDDEQMSMDFFVNGSGTLSQEVTDSSRVDASGNLNIDFSEIVRYVNWIKR